MFARLREKIQKEGGIVSDGERTLAPLPGHASPRRNPATAVSPSQSPVTKDRPALLESSSIDDGKTEYGTKEEVVLVLQKRTEQCKKLEAKVNEYMTMLIDNTKKVEKLEGFIEKQQDAVAKRSQELNEQFQASRAKAADKHQRELEQKEQEKQDLVKKLSETETLKQNYYKKESEKEEREEFTTQELGKLKHMLLMKEEELTSQRKELTERVKLVEEGEVVQRDLTGQLTDLREKLTRAEVDRSRLAEESVDHGKVVSALTKERMALEVSLTEVRTSLTEKTSSLNSMQSRYADLENKHQSLAHTSEVHKNKIQQQLQEREDRVSQLQDRVCLLEQREQDQSLTGDERLLALEKEREGLERKLAEAQEQLSQIKSSWSEKISHLEEQISHLNSKIAEDNEELKQAENNTDSVRSTMQGEIDKLQEKVKLSEKSGAANLELANTKDALFKKERLELETEISKMKLEKVDLDTQLRGKITSLESQLSTLEETAAKDKSAAQNEVAKYQSEEIKILEKLRNFEQQVEQLEDSNGKLQVELDETKKCCEDLRQEVMEKREALTGAETQNETLQTELRVTSEQLQALQKNSKSKDSELNLSNKDKDDLMVRNAELSQQLVTLQQSYNEEKRALEQEKQVLAEEVRECKEAEHREQQRCEELEAKIKELSEVENQQESNSEEITRLQGTISSLEGQVVEKNKALKKQEQRLADLKKTLQRELKVQSLPNDEPLDAKVAAITPPLPRKNSTNRPIHHPDIPSRTRRQNSHENGPPLPSDPYPSPRDNRHVSMGTQDYFVGQNLSFQGQGSHMGSHSSQSVLSSHGHATIAVNDQYSAISGNSSGANQMHTGKQRTARDFTYLEKDVNFQYLKHVVMKFMLSRESEAIHLIKAVSLLLRFTPDEQKLIKDTLEWKMSWFGGKQPPAVVKGLSSKIVPPSY